MTTLQLRLEVLGYDVGTADGVFGQKTLAAVKTFQRAKGLVADGVVGPKSAGALGLDCTAATHSAPQHTADSPASGSKSPAQGKTGTTPFHKNAARVLVEKFASEWSTNEEGLATALYGRGKDADLVTAAFKLVEDEYNEDSDDVALAYVQLVKARGGAPLEMLKQEAALRELLIHLLSSGVCFPDEDQAIQYLRELAGSPPSQVEAMVQPR